MKFQLPKKTFQWIQICDLLSDHCCVAPFFMSHQFSKFKKSFAQHPNLKYIDRVNKKKNSHF